MFRDIFGNNRVKLSLHAHTTRSDGRKTPEEAAYIYRAAGVDAAAFTDHWVWNPEGECNGLKLLSGAEYNIGGGDGSGFLSGGGVYHITAIGCTREPDVRTEDSPEKICAAVHAAGGIAVLAHPAWSLNDPATVAAQNCYDATEIFNTVSGTHNSCRPDSAFFCDTLACRGLLLPLFAADDAHYYDGSDAPVSYVCARAGSTGSGEVLDALRRGDFYSTQGPEIHMRREGDRLIVDCTPVSDILFISNLVWVPGRRVSGDGVTHAEYTVNRGIPDARGVNRGYDRFVRAEAIDAEGRRAWTNYIRI